MDLPDLPPGIRAARADDVTAILQLVLALAEHQRAAAPVETTATQLHNALFGAEPVARALVAQTGDEVVGFALYYLTFSTWVGRAGLHLEDLYVLPSTRGSGLGRSLMVALARIATHEGLGRLEWECLEWNTPSLEFYRRLGASTVDGHVTFRLAGDDLHQVAEHPTPEAIS
ncbi:GNAT family N-acetyltransferase [Aeromicrobium sp. CTD01-1L150]|uniref:GNAT family N-acetyltransferase n=1 Tax=Aeromicrobium sp. CTD01-1L150 TaxID=3341830 RepID=UPI0035C101A0